jgi:hypothetical protein
MKILTLIGLITYFCINTLVASAESAPTFSLRNFATCQEVKETLSDIMQTYSSRYWAPYPMLYARGTMLDTAVPTLATIPTGAMDKSVERTISSTNNQVA